MITTKLYNKKFSKIQKLGEGAYGKVYKVQVLDETKKDGEKEVYYALKKFEKKHFDSGMDFTALREITILKEINHENIVKVS